MIARKAQSRKIERRQYIAYYKKAKDFYQTMQDALQKKNWNSVGLEAVHCVISATDALLAYRSGIRCTSQKHSEVAQLLRSELRTADAVKNSKHLLKVIGMKNIVEYEAREFREKEAREVSRHTERYFNWVKSILPT